MNKNSLICKYIHANPETWVEDFHNIGIRFKTDGKYTIFKYNYNADFNNVLAHEARGIILDENLDVACIGFNKFFNQHEQFASKINWDDCRVQEKLDGSIVKLWFDTDKWVWATNGVIYAENAECMDLMHKNYLELIQDAVNYNDIDYNKLNTENTYIFEIVDPCMHTVKYPEIKLYHIGTRNNKTLREDNVDIGIEKPKEYSLHSLEEVIKFVQEMNEAEVTEEGVVVVDNRWNRIKIKNVRYLQMHYLNSYGLNKEKIISLLDTDDVGFMNLVETFPQYSEVIEFYKNEEENLIKEVDEYIAIVRQLYSFFNYNRKKLAREIEGHTYRYLGFKALNNEKTASELLRALKETNIASYCNLIKDYE